MFDKRPILESERVIVRPLREEDFAGLYAVASDPEIWLLHPDRTRYQESVFRQLFDDSLASGGAMVVIDKATGSIIGSSRYNVSDPDSGRAEIGWSFLARSHWGGSWNREVKHLLLSHAFRFVDVVYFRAGEANLRSRRAMEKIGGRLKEATEVIQWPNDRSAVHVFFEILKADERDQ